MRPPFLAIAICLSLVLCDCASADEMKFSSGSGDVGAFILKKATDFGGHPSTTNFTSSINTSWRYSEDKGGVVILTDRKNCAALETLLRQSFGAPRLSPTNNPEGIRFTLYRLSAKGGGIQMLCDSNYTQVIVLKPRNSTR